MPSRPGLRPTALPFEPGELAVDRPVVRETARRVARAAAHDAAARQHWAARAARRSETSPELVGLLARLEVTVVAYVHERRGAGLPIERVLPDVKALVREATVLEGARDPVGVLMAQVVRWTIAAFYDVPALAEARRDR